MKFILNIYYQVKNSFRLLKPIYKKKFYIIFIFILIGVFLEILSLASILPLANSLLDSNSASINFIKKYSENYNISSYENINFIYLFSFLFFLIFLLKNCYLFFLNKYQSKILADVTADLRSSVYKKYVYQTVLSVNEKKSHSFINNLLHNCNVYTNIFVYSVFSLLLEILVFSFFLVILFIYNPVSTLITLFIFGSMALLIIKFNKNRVLTFSRVLHDENLSLMRNIQNTFSGIKDIKINRKEFFFIKLIENNINKISDATYKSGIISIYPRYLLEIVAVFFLLLFFSLNFEVKNDGSFQISPFLFLFGAAIFRLLPSLNKIILSTNKFRHAATPVKTLISSITNLDANKEESDKEIKKFKFPNKTEINLKNIKFIYPESKNFCFNKLNWKIYGNKLIGLSGKSGAGKTTLVDILMGLKKQTSGEILINNHNIKKIKSNWFSVIGYVQQDVFMIDDSVLNNVAFGVNQKNINTKLVQKILSDVGLKDFISKLPEGLNTNIGERGSKISGGQKQRIALARALYQKPKILILDEATNGLDRISEKEIVALLNKLKKDIMIIFISHKTSILKQCDVVYELKKKNIYKKLI
jgi:ABC-type bacteriocin/lantibiotic exporter with double-glycine peptidase domain